MHAESLSFATQLAQFFQNYGPFAWNAMMLIAVIYLYRANQKAQGEKFALAMQIAPLAERMTNILRSAANAAKRARGRRDQDSTPT